MPTPELPDFDGKIGVTRSSLHAIAAGWQNTDAADSLDERAIFVVRVACDMNGCLIWGDSDVMWLSTMPFMAPIVERLYFAGRHVCGLTNENRTSWRKNLPSTGRRWFAFLLCRTVNTGFGLDVDRLLRETPIELFEEWRTLYELEPWADERADLAVGTAIAHVNACHGVEPKPPAEYMYYLHKAEPVEQSEEDMKSGDSGHQ